MRTSLISIFIIFSFISCTKKQNLALEVNNIIANKDLTLGLAFKDLNTGDSLFINGHQLFPLQSVYKFHVAAKALDEVDKNFWKLSDKIKIESAEIKDSTWSPLREEWGKKDVSIRLDSLIYYMVSKSDNNACDIILHRIKGPLAVNDYFKKLGFNNTKITYTEDEVNRNPKKQFENAASPHAVARALEDFYLRKYLSGDAHNFLWAMMSNSSTGKKRIKAGVPHGATVTHKTGTSGKDDQGRITSTNDAGIVTLPDGRSFVLVVFVYNSKEPEAVNEQIIADITRVLIK